MAITFANNIITVERIAGGKGSTAANPMTMADVFEASEANGWGVTRIGDEANNVWSYNVPWRLSVAASTYFNVIECNVIFSYHNVVLRSNVFYNASSSVMLLRNASITYENRIDNDNCYISLFSATIEYCSIIGFYGQYYRAGCALKGCLLVGWVSLFSDTVYNNCIIKSQNDAIDFQGSAEINNCTITGIIRSVYTPSNTVVVVRNLNISTSKNYQFMLYIGNAIKRDRVFNFIDSKFSNKGYAKISDLYTDRVNFLSTFKFDVECPAGAVAVVKDGRDNTVATLTLDGSTVSEELVKYYMIYVSGGNPDEVVDYQPFSVMVTAEGYHDMEFNDIVIDEGQPTVLRGKMVVMAVDITGVEVVHPGIDAGGSITVNATNGVTPYQYKLDYGSWQDENVFEGLSAGVYTVHVKDSAGNTARKEGIWIKKYEAMVIIHDKKSGAYRTKTEYNALSVAAKDAGDFELMTLVDKDDITAKARLETATRGRFVISAKGEPLFEKYAINSDDDEYLSATFAEATSDIVNKLLAYGGRDDSLSDELAEEVGLGEEIDAARFIVITITMKPSWYDTLINSIETFINKIYVKAMVIKWYEVNRYVDDLKLELPQYEELTQGLKSLMLKTTKAYDRKPSPFR